MKTYFIILSILTLLVLSGCEQYKEVSFETISKGDCLGRPIESGDYVIKNNQEWSEFWEKFIPKFPTGQTSNITLNEKLKELYEEKYSLPEINFENEMIIAVVDESHATGGYNIEIINIVESENSLKIIIEETSPKWSMIVTQAFTKRYQIIKIKKINKEFMFEH